MSEPTIEAQRDQYAAMLREFLELATDFSNTRRGYLRFLRLADEFEERCPELVSPNSPNYEPQQP